MSIDVSGQMAPLLDGIKIVADAATRDAVWPLATRPQNARVYRIDTGTVERWTGSAWVDTRLDTPFNVKAFGAVADWDGTTGTDNTGAFQAAIEAAKTVQGVVLIPNGRYKFTSTLTVYNGTIIEGSGRAQISGGNQNTIACQLQFVPGSLMDAFQVAPTGPGNPPGTPTYQTSLRGFALVCANALGRYGFNLFQSFFSDYSDLYIQGFQYDIYCKKTIFNKFTRVVCAQASVAAVWYDSGSATTDVWDSCTFYTSPIGVIIANSLCIRFDNCLFEQLDNYGMDVARDCEGVIVNNAYCEDVPFTNNANGCMFRVGRSLGGAFVVQNHLTVIGGKFAGRNAGGAGFFLDCDYSSGLELVGVTVGSNFPQIIRTTANTRVNSIGILGMSGIGWSTWANDTTRLTGLYPNSPLTTGTSALAARLSSVTATGSMAANDVATASAFYFPATQVPIADPNALDDYEEGIFTGVIGGSTLAGTYELAASAKCCYTKTGDEVTAHFRLVLAAAITGGGTISVRISGLPFVMSGTDYTGFTTVILNGIAFTGSYAGVERVGGGATTTLILYGIDNAGTQVQVPIANVGVNDQILFTIIYKAA